MFEITDFIALDNPERADQFEDGLLERTQKIAQAPRRLLRTACASSSLSDRIGSI